MACGCATAGLSWKFQCQWIDMSREFLLGRGGKVWKLDMHLARN
jgi:hypothetical protein